MLVLKEYRTLKPVPSLLSVKTVPLSFAPPTLAVPYRAPSAPIASVPVREAPSVARLKECRTTNPVPSGRTLKAVPPPAVPPAVEVPYRKPSGAESSPAMGAAPSVSVWALLVVAPKEWSGMSARAGATAAAPAPAGPRASPRVSRSRGSAPAQT